MKTYLLFFIILCSCSVNKYNEADLRLAYKYGTFDGYRYKDLKSRHIIDTVNYWPKRTNWQIEGII